MFWILKIYLDKKLRASEVRRRKAFIECNKVFLFELVKLNKQLSKLQDADIDDDIYLAILKQMDVKKTIAIIEFINVCANIMWLSRKRIDQLEKYVKLTREVVNGLIEESSINRKLDGFCGLQTTEQKTFKKFARLNLDNFISK